MSETLTTMMLLICLLLEIIVEVNDSMTKRAMQPSFARKQKTKLPMCFDCTQNIPQPKIPVRKMSYYENIGHYVFRVRDTSTRTSESSIHTTKAFQ